MNINSRQDGSNWRRATLAAVIAGAMSLAATVANAGECPADKKVADGQGQKMSTAAAKDVTDVVRASTDLSKEPAAVNGRLLRLRQLDMKPGAIVPWHSHGNRPAMIYIVSGEVIEYRQQLHRPDHAQGRRRCAGKEWHLALVAEQRQRHRGADFGGSVSGREHEGPAHDVDPLLRALGSRAWRHT